MLQLTVTDVPGVDVADRPLPSHAADGAGGPPPRRTAVVAVGMPELAALGDRLPARLTAPTTAALVAAIMARQPRAVATALFGQSPDILDLADRLARAGYRGRVLALAPPLPNRKLVRRELAAQGSGLRVVLVTLAALALPGPPA